MKSKIVARLFYFFICTHFLFWLLISYFIHFTSDEASLSFIRGTDIRIKGLKDIIKSLCELYMTWGGRLSSEFVMDYIILLGKPFYALVNAICFILFIFLIIRCVNLDKLVSKRNIFLYIVTLILTWRLLPLGEGAIWLAGSINYLWATVLGLVLFIPYRYLVESKYLLKDSKYTFYGIPILGIILGLWNETVSAGFLCAILLFLIIAKCKHIIIKKYFYSGFIGLAVGLIALIVAPGNYNRMSVVKKNDSGFFTHLKGLIIDYKNNIAIINQLTNMQLLIGTLILVLVGLILIIIFRKNIKTLFISAFMFIGTVGIIAGAIVSYGGIKRTLFIGIVFIIIGMVFVSDMIIHFAYNYIFNRATLVITRIVLASVLVLLLINTIGSMSNTLQDYKLIDSNYEQRIRIISENMASGVLDVKVPPLLYKLKNSQLFLWDVTSSPNGETNVSFAKYYGLNSIRLDTPKILIAYEENLSSDQTITITDSSGIQSDSTFQIKWNNGAQIAYFEVPAKTLNRMNKVAVKIENEQNKILNIKSVTIDTPTMTKIIYAKELSTRLNAFSDLNYVGINNDSIQLSVVGENASFEISSIFDLVK